MHRPWDIVVSLFRKAGKTSADALTQARLARILRHEDWDGGPILWRPPAV
jgi:DNA polymerase-1